MSNNKVFLKVYTQINLGDDLFIKMVLERYPNSVFYLNANPSYKNIFSNYTNLEIYTSDSSKSFASRFKNLIFRKLYPRGYQNLLRKNVLDENGLYFDNTDFFISIGGSIFIQPYNFPYYADVEYYNIVNEKYIDKNVFFIGCNFGPYNDSKYLSSYNTIFSKATDVCFRENSSKKLFSELKTVRAKPDVVFGLNYNSSPKEFKSVGFSIITPRNNISAENYISKYVDLINFYQELGYSIYLFSFCKKEGDEDTINTIVDKLINNQGIHKIFYDGNIDSFLSIYSKVEKVYCGRFHAMILSMIFNQKIYPIVYSKKMINVLNDINYAGKYLLIEDFENLIPSEVDLEFDSNKYEISQTKLDASKQFEILDSYLK